MHNHFYYIYMKFVMTHMKRETCRFGVIQTSMVGHGGALVESLAFNRRVVGSTPALAAM